MARVDNLVRVSVSHDDGAVTTWEPGFSIAQNANNGFFIGGYVPELAAWANAVRDGSEPPTQVVDVLPAIRLIERLAPDKDYRKQALHFPHWSAEDDWLRDR